MPERDYSHRTSVQKLGVKEGERIEVVDGLSAGDVVIRDPGDLVDGVAVQVSTTE